MILASTNFEFARLSGLWWLLVIVPCVLLLVRLVLWRAKARRLFADARLLEALAPRVLRARNGLRAALLALALVFLLLGLLDPRAGGRTETIEQSGIDVMVVIDVSRSMLAQDASPDRLTHAKQFAADLTDALGSDRVGLIEFAGVPALRCPLTFNHRAFLTQVDSLSPQATVRGGSMLGDAIRLAAQSMKGHGEGESDGANDGAGRVIVVLSDGEDMESEPLEAAADVAKERGIRIVTIGIGDAIEGARIPLSNRGAKSFLLHDGQEVWTKMNPALMESVAKAGNGFFVEAGVGQADMREVAALVRAGLAAQSHERAEVTTKDPQFQWFALLALAALVIECTLSSASPSLSPTRVRELEQS